MKISKILVREPINVNIVLPTWIIIFACAIPLIAYVDFIVIGGVSIKHYAIATGFECLLITMGYVVAKNTGGKK